MIKRNEQFLTISQIFSAITRRFFSVIFVAGALSVAGLIMLLFLRDVYTSEGEFYLNAGRGTVTIDPTATTSQVSNLMDTRQSEIQSIKDMLGSRIMLERTARRVGLDRMLEQRSGFALQKEKVMKFIETYLGLKDEVDDGMTAEQVADLERLQGAVEYIADRLSITGDKEGNTVQLKAKANTSLLAHDIVEALMSEFQTHYVNVHRTAGSQNFFVKELQSTQEKLKEAENNLADYKNKMRVLSVESKRDLLHKESELLQDEILKSEAEITSRLAEIAELNSMIEKEPAMMSVTATARSNAASDSMRGDLYKLEIEESELASRYSDEHPKLVKAREALKVAREAFENQDSLFDEKADAVNPVRQELTITRLKSASAVEALKAKLTSLNEKLVKNEEKILQLNSDEIFVGELTRAVELARDELHQYSRKREESRRQADLDEAMITALQISHPATHVIEKSGPPRLLGLCIICAGALLFACALAVYRESVASMADDDFSPTAAYGGRLETAGLHDTLNQHAKAAEYTLLSGRLNGTGTGHGAELLDKKSSKIQVHVSENIRG